MTDPALLGLLASDATWIEIGIMIVGFERIKVGRDTTV